MSTMLREAEKTHPYGKTETKRWSSIFTWVSISQPGNVGRAVSAGVTAGSQYLAQVVIR